ncbi:MAG: GGDEF domain-containing protein [Thiolinea sp.]
MENYQRESIWSLVHLNTQLNSTQYDMQLYSLGQLTEKELRVRYELMWSKFPVLLANLEKDDMLNKVNGLEDLIQEAFSNIKAMEPDIYSGESIDKQLLPRWIAEINHTHETIQRYLIHEVTDADGSYSQASWNKLLTALYFVAGTGLIFFTHIGYLLFSLARESSERHFQLSHDSLTGLASRNNTMQVLEEYCQAGQPFTLAIIDLNEFKKVNDNHGHQAGDYVLKHLAEFRRTLSRHGMVGDWGVMSLPGFYPRPTAN